MYSVKIASTNQQLNSILKLRYEVLRKPWSQTIDSATDQLEEKSINAFIQNNKGVYIACGRLQENENKIGQIRFMAVDQNYQGKGLGKLIITSLEEKAKDLQLNKIQLQARENAVSFYKNNGYVMIEKTFLLWDQIQHFLMEKQIDLP
jgi:N-acetylglutamate synthase-like GNAT family acetyltransferase